MQQKNFELEFAGRKYNTWYIRDKSHAISAIEQLQNKNVLFGFDVETVSHARYRHDVNAPLDPLRSAPRLVQICDGSNIVVLDLLHIGSHEFLSEFVCTKKLIAHNALFEIQHCLQNFQVPDVDIGCTYLATKLLYHALYPDDSSISASLESVVKALLKVDMSKDISHQHWGEPELTYEQVVYAACDAPATLLLANPLSSGLRKHGLEGIYALYKKAQAPIAKMQLTGIKMDEPLHRELIAEWKIEGYQAKKDLLKMTGLVELSPTSIREYLSKTLPPDVLDIWPKSESGKDLSLSADTFADFSWVPLVEPFSRFQKATILSSSFGLKLLNQVSPVTGRLHAKYKLCGTRTGRLSSASPNLQQIPRDKKTRAIFIAPAGRKFVVADFSQIELRVAAELSRDESMLLAYKAGRDLHALTAETVSGRSLSSMGESQAKAARQAAKALNFGLLFGLGKKKFKHYAKKQYKVEMTENEAHESVSRWHDLYSGYSEWQQRQAMSARESMQVRTATGKLRRLSQENYYGASANTPVQGSAAEVTLSAAIRLNDALDGSRDRLITLVHDEVMVETDDNVADIMRVKETLQTSMIKGFLDIFPHGITRGLVEAKAGVNWAEAK